MNLKVLLVLLGFGLWSWWAHYWYTCTQKAACYGCGDAAADVTPPPPTKAYGPLTFNHNQAESLTTDAFPAARDSMMAGRTEDNLLEIVGYYYDGETAPAGFDNMGLARAAAALKAMNIDLPEERVRLRGEKLATLPSDKDRFPSANFTWTEIKTDKSEVVEMVDKAIILFPFNSAQKETDTSVDEYLNRLAAQLKDSGGKVKLTGHTDNKGAADRNLKLGSRRAKGIRDLLIKKGVKRSQIETDSKGMSSPFATNDTDAGRHQNRRVEVELIK